MIRQTIHVVLLSLTVSSACWGTGLRAGAAKAAITPDVKANKVFMAGFGLNRVATGVHDDLYVRCLALQAGNQTLAICGVDVIGLFYEDVLKVRAEVKARAPEVTHVIVASTHDHEGPDTLGIWGPKIFETGVSRQYLKWLDERIAQTAVEAAHSMDAARMVLARDDSPALALLQEDSRPPYVKDAHLLLMELVSASSGKAIATLINWSDHPETLGSDNTEITADYPHWLCDYIEHHEGGTAVFINGAIGGLLSTLGSQVALQNPETGEVAKDGTWEKAKLAGTLLGELAVQALKTAGKQVDVDALAVRQKAIFVPMANELFRFDAGMGTFAGARPLYSDGKLDTATIERPASELAHLLADYLASPAEAAALTGALGGQDTLKYAAGKDLQSEVDYVELLSKGSTVAEIATVPGEIYPELVNGGITRYSGADFPGAPFEPTLRSHMKSSYPFVFGLANDEIGYIIPKAEWDNQPPWLQNRPQRWYGEVNSAGPDAASTVLSALVSLIAQE